MKPLKRLDSVRSNRFSPNSAQAKLLDISEVAHLADQEVIRELNRMERNAKNKTAQDRCRTNDPSF